MMITNYPTSRDILHDRLELQMMRRLARQGDRILKQKAELAKSSVDLRLWWEAVK